MSAVLEHPDTLASIRERIADLSGDLAIVDGHVARCEAEAKKVGEAQAAHAQARAALEALHARRIGGETISEREIESAEAKLSGSAAALGRAERAAEGGKQAAAKYEAEAATIRAQIASLRSQSKPLVTQILVERARESMRKHALAVEEFAQRVQVAHHAEIAAIDAVARELGITHSVFTYPNKNARLLQVACTPTPDRYLEIYAAHEIGPEIDAQAAVIASELRSLIV